MTHGHPDRSQSPLADLHRRHYSRHASRARILVNGQRLTLSTTVTARNIRGEPTHRLSRLVRRPTSYPDTVCHGTFARNNPGPDRLASCARWVSRRVPKPLPVQPPFAGLRNLVLGANSSPSGWGRSSAGEALTWLCPRLRHRVHPPCLRRLGRPRFGRYQHTLERNGSTNYSRLRPRTQEHRPHPHDRRCHGNPDHAPERRRARTSHRGTVRAELAQLRDQRGEVVSQHATAGPPRRSRPPVEVGLGLRRDQLRCPASAPSST